MTALIELHIISMGTINHYDNTYKAGYHWIYTQTEIFFEVLDRFLHKKPHCFEPETEALYSYGTHTEAKIHDNFYGNNLGQKY